MQTWELITAVGAIQKIPTKLYSLPDKRNSAEREAWLRAEFELKPELTEIADVNGNPAEVSEKELMHLRDEQVVREADILIPISIRRSGAMMKLVEQARADGKEIVADFRCEYADRSGSLAYTISSDDINPELSAFTGKYLSHWTRTTNSAWPGERMSDYYKSVIASASYPRTAFDTLKRIVETRRLIASPRHMPGKIPTVSFTALAPEETAPLMRWRARFAEMSFEPYSVGIDLRACAKLEIQPVRYYERAESISKEAEDFWLSQSIGMITDWRQEKEFRCRGDMSLEGLTSEQLIVVTRTPDEAREIEKRFGVRAISFCRM